MEDDTDDFFDGLVCNEEEKTEIIISTDMTAVISTSLEDDRIQTLENLYPGFCFRYKSQAVLIQNRITFWPLEGDWKECSIEAIASDVVSPVEFYMQPMFIEPAVLKMQKRLQEAYTDEMPAINIDEVFVDMPCVARFSDDKNWYRARLEQTGGNEAVVQFVDYGNRQFCPFTDIKPLKMEFAKLPPATLHCRVKGARERALEQKVVDKFVAEIDSLGNLLRVRIYDLSTPFHVDIYNMVNDEDVGLKYLPREPIVPEMPPMSLLKKKSRETGSPEKAAETSAQPNERGEATDSANQNSTENVEVKKYYCDLDAFLDGAGGFNSSDDDSDDGNGAIKRRNKKIRKIKHEQALLKAQELKKQSVTTSTHHRKPLPDEERIIVLPNSGRSFQIQFRKSPKPMSGTADVWISHVESTRAVYVKTEHNLDVCDLIEGVLASVYDLLEDDRSIFLLPQYVEVENACVVRDPTGQWKRCRITQVDSEGVILQTTDYGVSLPVIPAKQYYRLKALLHQDVLDYCPQCFHCKLTTLCEQTPTVTENELLKELLPVGVHMHCKFERVRAPWRVVLTDPERNTDFNDIFEAEIKKRHLKEAIEKDRRPCTAVALYNPTVPAQYSKNQLQLQQLQTMPKSNNGYFGGRPPKVATTSAKTESSQESVRSWELKRENMHKAMECGGAAAMATTGPGKEKVAERPIRDMEAVFEGGLYSGSDQSDDIVDDDLVPSCDRATGNKSEKEDDEDYEETRSVIGITSDKKERIQKWLHDE